jgi:hypothetical protein
MVMSLHYKHLTLTFIKRLRVHFTTLPGYGDFSDTLYQTLPPTFILRVLKRSNFPVCPRQATQHYQQDNIPKILRSPNNGSFFFFIYLASTYLRHNMRGTKWVSHTTVKWGNRINSIRLQVHTVTHYRIYVSVMCHSHYRTH